MQLAAIVVSLVLTAVAVALFGRAAVQLVRVLRLGQPVPAGSRTDAPGQRTRTLAREFLAHTRLNRRPVVGVAHWFVAVGFLTLGLTIVQAFGQLFRAEWTLPVLGGFLPYEMYVEFIAALTTLGIATLIVVRLVNRPARSGRASRFAGSTAWQGYFVEYVILTIGLAILVLRGLEGALHHHATSSGDTPGYDAAHFVSYPLVAAFDGLGTSALQHLVYLVAALKLGVTMVWAITVALNTTMGVAWHRFLAFPNIWFKRRADGGTALGALQPMTSAGKPIDFETVFEEDGGEETQFGVSQVEHFSWKGLLDFSTCTECGRCQSQCPAWNTGKPLSPKQLVMSLRDHAHAKAPYLLAAEQAGGQAGLQAGGQAGADAGGAARAEAERPLVGTREENGVIDPDVLWSCTTCGACVEQCPVDIEHVDHIVDMRRYQVMIESAFPSEAGTMLKNLERKGNPWGLAKKKRLEWTRELAADTGFEVPVVGRDVEDLSDVDYLYWVGCAGALEDRARKTTKAFAELLHIAGVRFAVMGGEESCTGDSARRLGNEFLFQQLGTANIAALDAAFGDAPAKKIVTTCPHCFNTLANEYPQLGGDYEVLHHTQLLQHLIEAGRLVPVTPVEGLITYHDPCYLGRHNQVYTPPREIIGHVPGLRNEEMHRHKERGFCCGAGGARMWMEERLGKRINDERVDEALSLNPDIISTACPFCLVMLTDSVNGRRAASDSGSATGVSAKENLHVVDVAQLLLDSVRTPAGHTPTGNTPDGTANGTPDETADQAEDKPESPSDAGTAAEPSPPA